jgi:hypothetical protein
MASYVDSLILKCAAKNGQWFDNKPVIPQHGLTNFIRLLGMDTDMRWALQRGARFFNYFCIAQCRVSDGLSPADSLYDLPVFSAVLACLGVPDSSYDWEACHIEIERNLGLPSAAPAHSVGPENADVIMTPAPAHESAFGSEHTRCAAIVVAPAPDPGAMGILSYEDKSPAELRALLVQRDRTIKQLRMTNRDMRQTNSRVNYRFKARLILNDKAKKQNRVANDCRGKNSRWYTPRGGFLLAARRCLSNCAAYGIGFAIMRDVHHKTVCRWEIRLRAALVASSREFFRHATSEMAHHAMSGEPGFMFLINQYRSDATNADVWQRSKLHVTEVTSCFTPQPVLEETPFRDTLQQIQQRTIIGDLQVVRSKQRDPNPKEKALIRKDTYDNMLFYYVLTALCYY